MGGGVDGEGREGTKRERQQVEKLEADFWTRRKIERYCPGYPNPRQEYEMAAVTRTSRIEGWIVIYDRRNRYLCRSIMTI